MTGLKPTAIHITNADGEVIRNGIPNRKRGRSLARELSSSGAVVYLMDAHHDVPRVEYRGGYQPGRPGSAAPLTTPANSPAPHTLPDLLRPGLDLVFVGISPAEYSARVGHYYSHSNNDFWKVLSASSLVPERVESKDDRRLPADYRIGLTDVVKRVVTDSTEVSPAEIRAARPDFERRIAAAAPRMICFNGKQAFEAVFPGEWRPGQWGCQRAEIAGAQVWVMPSTSGAARGNREHNGCVLEDIARALGRRAAS